MRKNDHDHRKDNGNYTDIDNHHAHVILIQMMIMMRMSMIIAVTVITTIITMINDSRHIGHNVLDDHNDIDHTGNHMVTIMLKLNIQLLVLRS